MPAVEFRWRCNRRLLRVEGVDHATGHPFSHDSSERTRQDAKRNEERVKNNSRGADHNPLGSHPRDKVGRQRLGDVALRDYLLDQDFPEQRLQRLLGMLHDDGAGVPESVKHVPVPGCHPRLGLKEAPFVGEHFTDGTMVMLQQLVSDDLGGLRERDLTVREHRHAVEERDQAFTPSSEVTDVVPGPKPAGFAREFAHRRTEGFRDDNASLSLGSSGLEPTEGL